MTKNNISVIPFYDTIEEQARNKWGEDLFPLRMFGSLLPFIITKLQIPEFTSIDLHKIELVNACIDEIIDITDVMQESGCLFDTDNYLTFAANNDTLIVNNKGCYYLHIQFRGQSESGYQEIDKYSEVFSIMGFGEIFYSDKRKPILILEWYSQENQSTSVGVIPYGDIPTFKNFLILDAEVTTPQYQTSEEGEERDGYFFPIKQLSWKEFNFSFITHEYVCDVLRLAFLSDVVKINDIEGNEYKCDTFNIDVNWLEQNRYASVRCTFTTDTVVKAVGKAYQEIQER